MKEIEWVRESRYPCEDAIIEDATDILGEWEKHEYASEKERNYRKVIRSTWPRVCPVLDSSYLPEKSEKEHEWQKRQEVGKYMGFFFFEIDDHTSHDRTEEKVKSEEEGIIRREPFAYYVDSSRPGKRYPEKVQ